MIAPERLEQRYDTLVNYEEDSSAESRFWNWEFCRRVGFARPLTGGGFDFYDPRLYDRYYPEFKERWGDRILVLSQCLVHHPRRARFSRCHSLVVVDWVLSYEHQANPRLRQEYSDNSSLVDFADMAQSSMAAYFLVGTFLDAAYFDLFYYLVALIIIMKGIVVGEAERGICRC